MTKISEKKAMPLAIKSFKQMLEDPYDDRDAKTKWSRACVSFDLPKDTAMPANIGDIETMSREEVIDNANKYGAEGTTW